MRNLKIMMALVVVTLIVACGNSKMKSLSNAELAMKQDECIRNNPTSPGKVTGCENVRKECERRRKEGNFAC